MEIRACKHCKQKFDISDKPSRWFLNHSRWCEDNPKSRVKNQYSKARIEGREIPKGKKNTVKYKGILLDSTWELKLAKRLDELGIEWYRPRPIKWKDKEGISHNYFPDFYLPKYNLYIDPKNKHAYDVQTEKIEILRETYPNILFLTTEIECETYRPPKE